MKKAKRMALLASLAAAALALAAGCSDGTSEDWIGAGTDASKSADEQGAQDAQDAQGESGQGADASKSADDIVGQGELLAITQDDVLELIQAIGQLSGINNKDASYVYWDFPLATLDEDEGGLVAIVSWYRTNNQATSPGISHTLSNLQERGKVSTELLSVDLSKANWDDNTDERRQTEKGSSGYRYVTVTIDLAEGASAELAEELEAITIAFNSERTWY